MKAMRDLANRFRQCYDPASICAYILKSHAPEADAVIRQANQLMDHTFTYTDRWDMEPCPVPYTIPVGNWLLSPNGDPEWIFMLNRHDFLHKLWQAYLLTGDSRYAAKLRFFLLDWIEKNPITQQGTDATRTIDTGIRCMNWTILLLHLLSEEILSDEDAKLIIHSLREQHFNMQSRYIGKYALSNWGVLQTTAICAGHLWFPEQLPADVAAWAWQELKQQLKLQILGDGSHWEQSAMYHVEVLNTCAKLLMQIQYASALGHPLCAEARRAADAAQWTVEAEASAGPGEGYDPDSPGWLTEAVRVLSRHVLHTADPAFLQLAQGDSDVTDVRDVCARAAVLLSGGGIYRFVAGETLDYDSAWLMGAMGIRAYEKTTVLKPIPCSWNCHDSGNVFFRSGWDQDADFTWLKCGSLGSSHGHADQTHLTLYRKGKPFLVDSGRYTYLEEDPLRVLLKSACAHNVCVIDGQSGGEPNGSWSYHSYDEVLKNYVSEADGAHYVEMAFHGQLKDGTPYLIKRKVLALDEGVWLSVQDVICQGEHTVKEYFHLDEQVRVEMEDEHCVLRNGDVSLTLQPLEKMQLRHGVISKRYNEKDSAPILIKHTTMRNRMTSHTLIADASCKVNPVPVYQMRREEPVPPETAVAWDVEIPDGRRKTLILWNRETCRGDKLYTCHGQSVYGKAAVLSWDGDRCTTIRLKT